VNGITCKGLSTEAGRAQCRVEWLLNWRKGARAIHQSKLMHFFPKQGVYVYFRYLDKEKYMIVLNPADKAVSLELAPFAEMLGSASTAQDVLTGRSEERRVGKECWCSWA